MLDENEVRAMANKVVQVLGSDFEEKIYQEAFLAELRLRRKDLEYDRERIVPIFYFGQQVGAVRADVVVRDSIEEIVLELKAGSDEVKEKLKNELKAYLRAMRMSRQTDESTTTRRMGKGFVVIFPCTPGTKEAQQPRNEAVVAEVKLEEDKKHVVRAAS